MHEPIVFTWCARSTCEWYKPHVFPHSFTVYTARQICWIVYENGFTYTVNHFIITLDNKNSFSVRYRVKNAQFTWMSSSFQVLNIYVCISRYMFTESMWMFAFSLCMLCLLMLFKFVFAGPAKEYNYTRQRFVFTMGNWPNIYSLRIMHLWVLYYKASCTLCCRWH